MINFLQKIDEIRKKRQLREPYKFVPDGSVLRGKLDNKEVVNFSSNSYLGLDSHPEIKKAVIRSIEDSITTSGSSRLISGTQPQVTELEQKIAAWKGYEKALYFNTGYMANSGVISAVCDRHTDIFLDKLNHASIVDGAKLSRGNLVRYPHNDYKRLEKLLQKSLKSQKVIVTDTIFSMDGDIAPLVEIVGLARKYDALLITDEAHAGGVFGENGCGIAEYFGLKGKIDIEIGTFSKALGSIGGYVTANESIIKYLYNNARSFIYTTAAPPYTYAAVKKAIDIVSSEEGRKLRSILHSRMAHMKELYPDTTTQIVPIIVGAEEKALDLFNAFLENGIFAVAIRPPTVPAGSSRIRLSLSAGHTEEEFHKLISLLQKVARHADFS